MLVLSKSAVHGQPPVKEFHKDLLSVLCLSISSSTDDKTFPHANFVFQIVKLYLEKEAEKCIWWFVMSCMKANLDKLRAIS